MAEERLPKILNSVYIKLNDSVGFDTCEVNQNKISTGSNGRRTQKKQMKNDAQKKSTL